MIITGTPNIYYLLYNVDPEYNELFKVKADFDSRMERTPENECKVRRTSSPTARRRRNSSPSTGAAWRSSWSSGRGWPTTRRSFRPGFSSISDLMREAHYWAKKDGSHFVRGEHVTQAIDEKVYTVSTGSRSGLREATLEDTLIIGTSGEKVGQVNGLAVLDIGRLQLRQALAHHGHART